MFDIGDKVKLKPGYYNSIYGNKIGEVVRNEGYYVVQFDFGSTQFDEQYLERVDNEETNDKSSELHGEIVTSRR